MLSGIIDLSWKLGYTPHMNQEMIAQIEDLGLSNKEARVYVANLMLGPASVQQIADYAEIKRVTTYVILESLISLGLVSQTMKGKKTLFVAEDPSNLRRLLEKREQELAEQKTSFEQVLPELQSLKTLPEEAPGVKFYEGADGIKTLFSSFFSLPEYQTSDISGISNLDQVHEFFPDFEAAGGNPERLKRGIKSKLVYTSAKGPIYQQDDSDKLRVARYVPIDKYPLSGDFSIVGDHVFLLSLGGKKPIGISIHSREITKGFRAIFDMAWDKAEQYNR